jgi:hypothetical protein
VPERSFSFRIGVFGGGATELYLEKRQKTPLYFKVRDFIYAKGGLEAVAEVATPPPGAA